LLAPLCSPSSKNPTSISYIIIPPRRERNNQALGIWLCPIRQIQLSNGSLKYEMFHEVPTKNQKNPNNPQYVLPNENDIIS
jgi:hypothetical protein